MGNRETGITVLMLPWLGHGHISPFLELGKRFARKGLSIYLCSTPVNLRSVKQTLENNPFIKTVELHLPNLPDLPPHYHTTKGLPPNLLSTLNKAYDMAAPNFSNIVHNLKPDLLIYDFIQFWAPQVALSQNIPSVFFITTGAATSSYIIHKHVNPNTPFPFPAIYCKGYEKEKYEDCAKVNPYVKIIERIVSCARQSHEVILVKSCNEMEGKYNDYLSTLCEKTIIPVGPLVSEKVNGEEDDHFKIFEWLDKKDKASTVFVSFGSECFLSKEEMEEIACGLEISCVNFLWVVRSPFGEKCLGESLKELRERIGEKGKILDTWAPQGRILGHPSIGGFVSHCGWGSVMEAVTFGIPVIAIPMQYDQPLNARVVQEAGLGEEVKRGRNGRLQMGEIAKVVRKMVLDEDGDEVRRKTKYLSESIRDREDNKDFDMVVKELTKICNIS
ncbi:Glycosyltransferase [Heracleum sosnowskyi]|uniref:Glycosyltransferase n=1 Tax=Heracleum sosnowskyi TaxID=360622 RepID=A0AAD8JHK6_9APIA|nr:Glycosyltransferase [Heracleum sosnowskyi]